MSRFFKPYEGTRPYLFISYAHKQSEEVSGSSTRRGGVSGTTRVYLQAATGPPTSPDICRAAREYSFLSRSGRWNLPTATVK